MSDKQVNILAAPTGPTGTFRTVNIAATGPFAHWDLLDPSGVNGPTGTFQTVIGMTGQAGRKTIVPSSGFFINAAGYLVKISDGTLWVYIIDSDGVFLVDSSSAYYIEAA